MLTKTGIEKYFIAEKQESLVFLVIGIIAVVLALLGWLLWKTPVWKGAAIPLLVMGCIQLAAGYAVYSRSDAQRIDNVYAFDMNPQQLKEKELPRMQNVNQRFAWYRWIEIVLALAGIALIVYSRQQPGRQFWYGLGLTLALEVLLLLGGNYFAAKRAQTYTQDLSAFVNRRS